LNIQIRIYCAEETSYHSEVKYNWTKSAIPGENTV